MNFQLDLGSIQIRSRSRHTVSLWNSSPFKNFLWSSSKQMGLHTFLFSTQKPQNCTQSHPWLHVISTNDTFIDFAKCWRIFPKVLRSFCFDFSFITSQSCQTKTRKLQKMALFFQVFYNILLKRKQLRQLLKSQVEKVKTQDFWKLEVPHLSEFSFFMSKGQN